MKKTKICVAAMSFFMAGAMNAQQVVLVKADGTQVKLHVSEFKDITFHDDAWVDPSGEPNRVPMRFSATFEDQNGQSNGAHKVAFSGDGTKNMNWNTGDKVSVLYSGKNEVFTLADGVGTTEGKFSGVTSGTPTDFTVLSPYQESAQFVSAGVATNVSLPSLQTATAGTFDPAAGLMFSNIEGASTEEPVALGFQNVTSYLMFTVPAGKTFEKIIVTSLGGEALAGTVKLDCTGDAPTWTAVSTSSTVVLQGNMTAGNTYYISVLPGTKSGFNVQCVGANTGKSTSKSYSSNSTFVRSQYHNCTGMISSDVNPYLVDMGLDEDYHRYWSAINVGATNASDVGEYIAWAETEPQTEQKPIPGGEGDLYDLYSFGQYKYGDGKDHNSDLTSIQTPFVTKYGTKAELQGTITTTLDATDDAATVRWGENWCMPDDVDFSLLANCKHEYTSNYKGTGQKGMIIYTARYSGTESLTDGTVNTSTAAATKGQEITHIFLPYGGYYDVEAVNANTTHGYYWSRTVAKMSIPASGQTSQYTCYSQAYDLLLTTDEGVSGMKLSTDYRRGGQNIRPVYGKKSLTDAEYKKMVLPLVYE